MSARWVPMCVLVASHRATMVVSTMESRPRPRAQRCLKRPLVCSGQNKSSDSSSSSSSSRGGMVGSNIGCVPPNSKNNSTKNNAGQTPTLSSACCRSRACRDECVATLVVATSAEAQSRQPRREQASSSAHSLLQGSRPALSIVLPVVLAIVTILGTRGENCERRYETDNKSLE